MTVLQILLPAIFLLLVKIVTTFLSDRKFKVFAEQNGCKEPADVTGPFPWGFKRLDRMMKMKKTGEDILDDIVSEDFNSGSTVQFKAFDRTPIISTIEPENVQAMLATQFHDFGVGSRRYTTFSPLIGMTIFSSDGAFWERSRALFRPQFSRDNINDLEMTEKASRDLITAIGPTDASGWTQGTSMMPLLFNFTLDTATDFLFGQSVESQQLAIASRNGSAVQTSAEKQEAKAFAESFSIVEEGLVRRLRLQSLYWLGDGIQFRKAIKRVQDFVNPIVQRSLEIAASSAEGQQKKQSLMVNLATQTQDRTELRNQTLAILLAGRDTTASMLGFALIRLALHPEVFTKLRSVVLREFEPGSEISFSKLKGCRYLQHFLNEVLRLHPTVPLNQRSAAKDTTLPVGGGPDQRSPIAVRKGQIVLFSVYLMQRRKDLWGDDALEFKPERWEQRVPAWQFLPFLGGPRICLGQQFALTEASYLLVTLLHEFDAIEPVDRTEMAKLKKAMGVTMWPGGEAKMRFRKASLV